MGYPPTQERTLEANHNMTSPKPRVLPLTVDIDLSDDTSVEEAAKNLGTTPQMVRDTLRFAQVVMLNAEEKDLTAGQLLTALMSVMSVLVRDCGNEVEQSEMCVHLFEGLWSSVGLPSDRTPIPSKQVH